MVIAGTTTPRPKDMPRFRIPSRQENQETGLSQTCWALPRWYLRINPYRLKELKGNCPLRECCMCHRRNPEAN